MSSSLTGAVNLTFLMFKNTLKVREIVSRGRERSEDVNVAGISRRSGVGAFKRRYRGVGTTS